MQEKVWHGVEQLHRASQVPPLAQSILGKLQRGKKKKKGEEKGGKSQSKCCKLLPNDYIISSDRMIRQWA